VQRYIGGKRPKLFVFDILALNDESLCHLDYDTRIEKLRDLIKSSTLSKAVEQDLL